MTIGIASPHLTSHLNKKVKLSPAVKGEQALPMAGVQASAQPDTRISERDSITDFSMGLDQDYQLQPMVSLDEKLAGSQPTVVPSAAGTQMLKQQEPSGILSQQDIQTQREEIKNQMKQFMLHLRSKASKGEISQERAKLTVEKVRQEAAKKLQYMDLLESQQNASPDLGQVTLPLLDAQQPPLVPNQSQPLQPATLPQQPQHINAALAEKQASIPKTPVPSNLVASPQKSPSNLPVWSGAIQWSFVDPMNKSKKELAFYVDAVPLRASAAAELYVAGAIEPRRYRSICRLWLNSTSRCFLSEPMFNGRLFWRSHIFRQWACQTCRNTLKTIAYKSFLLLKRKLLLWKISG